MTEEFYLRHKEEGWSDTDIERIWQETLHTRKLMAERLARNEEPREITSGVYKRKQARIQKQIFEMLATRHR